MTTHLIFSGAGIYTPRICPKAVLWQRTDDTGPLFGVFVGSAQNASKFANVAVVKDGIVTEQYMQKEQAQ